nr:MAG TPA: hypothetical protein [Caudoviricetes sp.]
MRFSRKVVIKLRNCSTCSKRGYCIPDECEDLGIKNEPDDVATSTSSN